MMRKGVDCLSGLLLALGVTLIIIGGGYIFLAKTSRLDRTIGPIKRGIAQVAEIVSNQFSDTGQIKRAAEVPVPILMYHYIREVDSDSDPLGYGLSVAPELFADQLDALKEAGYQTITPSQFLKGEFEENALIISFDDGYEDFYTEAFPALKDREMVAVVFPAYGLLGDESGQYLTFDQVKEIAAAGFEIGSHTVSHSNLTNLKDQLLQDELLESRSALEKISGQRVIAVSYPAGEYDDRVRRYADFTGYKFGVTTKSGFAQLKNDRLTLPRIRVSGGEATEDLLRKIKTN